MKWLLPMIFSVACHGQLVPFFSDASYQRDEPTDPPWWVANNGQPSKLYRNGVYQSQETGTNDLNLAAAWTVQPKGAKIGVIDMTAHGDRVEWLARLVGRGEVHRYELSRWDAQYVAAGVSNCADAGCRVITLTTGYPTPDDLLLSALRYASNCVVVCAVPDSPGNLDGAMVDYPYAYRLPNVVGVNCTDRNGEHYWSAEGTNCVGAPGRNIVAAGTYSSGSSYAAPILAGVFALLMERFPGQTPEAYIVAVKLTGAGRVNPLAALLAPVPTLSAGEDGIDCYGLGGWRYELEQSQDLIRWGPATEIQAGFYRAKVL